MGRKSLFQTLNGKINKGMWSQIYSDEISFTGYSPPAMVASFNINKISYFIYIHNSSLYSYCHHSSTFNYIMKNPVFGETDFSVVYNNSAFLFSENKLYKFNPEELTLTKTAKLKYSESLYGCAGFIIEDNIHIGIGQAIAIADNKSIKVYSLNSNQLLNEFQNGHNVKYLLLIFQKTVHF